MSEKFDPLQIEIPPEIEKRDEYLMVCRLIDKGLWRNINLAKAASVDDETIAIWKKTGPIKKLYAKTVMKFLSRRKDEEAILKELEVESVKDVQEHIIRVIPILGGQSAIQGNNSDTKAIEAPQED